MDCVEGLFLSLFYKRLKIKALNFHSFAMYAVRNLLTVRIVSQIGTLKPQAIIEL